MIYTFPSQEIPIRQGDIFTCIPRATVTLKNIATTTDENILSLSWDTIAKEGKAIKAILPVTPVCAIVATQNCDALTSPEITLCEIREFTAVEGKAKTANSPKAWKNIITQHARMNKKWFYLPPDTRIGFSNKMAVDFRCTIRVPRTDLEGFRNFQKGALNTLANQHFRERLGQFFRRYPYNEWYPLDSEELKQYEKGHNCSVSPRYPWQE